MSTTLSQCQQLVAAIAAVAANYVDQELLAARLILREYHPEGVYAGDTTAISTYNSTTPLATAAYNATLSAAVDLFIGTTDETGAALSGSGSGNGALSAHAATAATAPVAQMLANPNSLNSVVRPMAVKLAAYIEAAVFANWSSFSSLTAVGVAGTAITDANILAAAQEMDASNIPAGEPRYLALKQAGITSGASNGNTWDNFLALANVVNSALVGVPTVTADYLLRSQLTYRGFRVFPSRNVGSNGSTPATMHNFAFTPSSMILVIGQQTPVNDSTHVQQISVSTAGDMAVQVRLDFDGTNTPLIALKILHSAQIARLTYGLQFKT